MSFDTSTQFALINGGKSDLLVTGMTCIYSNPNTGRGLIPRQRIAVGDGKEWLLSAGKARHCFVQFLEQISSERAVTGIFDPNRLGLYFFNLEVMVEWTDMNGVMKKKTVALSEVGMDEQGNIRMSGPIGLRYDMNDSADITGLHKRRKALFNS